MQSKINLSVERVIKKASSKQFIKRKYHGTYF